MAPDVSIIVPFYNAEPYLHRCIESIQAQTLRDIEVILIDDGSTDRSGAIAEEYAAIDSRLRVFHQANCGASTARNKGLDVARGTYIGFVDADDWVEKRMYEVLFTYVNENDADMAMSNYYVHLNGRLIVPTALGELGEDIFENPERIAFSMLSDKPIEPSVICNLYRFSLLKNHGIRFDVDVTFGEDLIFNLLILRHTKRVVIYSTPLYHYMREWTSTTAKYNKEFWGLRTQEYDRIIHILEDYPLHFRSEQRLRFLRVRMLMSCQIDLCKPGNRRSIFSIVHEMKELLDKDYKGMCLSSLVRADLPGSNYNILFQLIKHRQALLIVLYLKIYDRLKSMADRMLSLMNLVSS